MKWDANGKGHCNYPTKKTPTTQLIMMTSSNGNIFRVTGPLCGEFTGPGEFPTQRSVTLSFDVFFDLRPNKWLSKQPWGWWFETPSCSLWRQCNDDIFSCENFLHLIICLNSLKLSASVNKIPLVQIMACCLNGTKPLSKPMLEYC